MQHLEGKILRCVHTMPRGRMQHTAAMPPMWSRPHEKRIFCRPSSGHQNCGTRSASLVWFFSQTGWYHFENPYSSYVTRLLLIWPTICRSNFWAAQHQTACRSLADATSTYTCGMAQLMPHGLAALCHCVPRGIVWTYL